MRDGIEYLTDADSIWNFVDLLTAALNLWLVFQTFAETEASGVSDRRMIQNCTALAVILMWSKIFYWMNISTSYSFYIKLIKATIQDIGIFASILIVLFMMLANVLMILNDRRYEDVKFVQEIFSLPFLDAFMNQYMLALGEFDIENYGQNHNNDVEVWLLFILSTFGSQILFLNMLIAVMADTFERVKEMQKESALKESI